MKIQFKKHGRLIMYNGGQETGTMRDGEVKNVSPEVAERLISDFPNNFNTPEGWKKEKESESKGELDKEEKKEKEHKGKAGDKKKEHSDGSKEKSEINISEINI